KYRELCAPVDERYAAGGHPDDRRARRSRRTDGSRARSCRAAGTWPHEPGHRSGPVHRPPNRRAPRRQSAQEAWRAFAYRGRGVGDHSPVRADAARAHSDDHWGFPEVTARFRRGLTPLTESCASEDAKELLQYKVKMRLM